LKSWGLSNERLSLISCHKTILWILRIGVKEFNRHSKSKSFPKYFLHIPSIKTIHPSFSSCARIRSPRWDWKVLSALVISYWKYIKMINCSRTFYRKCSSLAHQINTIWDNRSFTCVCQSWKWRVRMRQPKRYLSSILWKNLLELAMIVWSTLEWV
jgi:hypothetical protein